MIKYNSNTISDWNYGSDNIVKVYRNNAVCYYKITGGGDTPTPVQEPCFAVVDDISQYSYTEFVDVYNKADEKWYKLNNLNQYEEYGVYGSGRNITYYEGKLTIDNGYEYEWNGSSWVNLGEVSGSSKTSDFTIGDINDNVTIKSSIADGDYYVISYYNHNNPKEPRYMMSYTESNNYLNNFSGHTGSNSITPSTIIDAAIWKFEATSSANTYYIKNIHNNLYWGYQRRASTRSLNLVGESDSSKAIVKVGVANSATTVGFVELNVNGSSYTYEDGTVGGYALNQLNGYTYRMNWWNTGGWGSDGNSAYYLYKIEGGTIVYPVEYDEMQDPPNNVSFSSMTEAEAYECPWVGMNATIAGDKYVFSGDSQSGYEWVEVVLPYDAEIQYLQSSGTQYINTGAYLNTSNFEVGYETADAYCLWGYCHQNVGNGTWLGLECTTSQNTAFFGRFGSSYMTNISSYITSGNNAIVYKQNGLTVNGNTISKNLTMGTDSIANTPLTFFARYDFYKGGMEWQYDSKFKSFYLKNNDEYVVDMIPVRVGQIGYMYDKISGQLFGNAGTGSFILGPDK